MIQRHGLFMRLLAAMGVESERCRLEFVSASESEKFARVAAETVEAVRQLGAPGPAPRSAPRLTGARDLLG